MAIEKIRVNGVDYDLGVSGGSEGSGGGMPDLAYNNPDLPNLYYGMSLTNKTKIKIDFVKMADWLENHAFPTPSGTAAYQDWGVAMNYAPSGGSMSPYVGIFNILEITNLQGDFSGWTSEETLNIKNGINIGFKGDGYFIVKKRSEMTTEELYRASFDGQKTYRNFFEEIGILEITLADEVNDASHCSNLLITGIMNGLYGTGNPGQINFHKNIDLNTYPIDFITIE